jgi:hypothetical protein
MVGLLATVLGVIDGVLHVFSSSWYSFHLLDAYYWAYKGPGGLHPGPPQAVAAEKKWPGPRRIPAFVGS